VILDGRRAPNTKDARVELSINIVLETLDMDGFALVMEFPIEIAADKTATDMRAKNVDEENAGFFAEGVTSVDEDLLLEPWVLSPPVIHRTPRTEYDVAINVIRNPKITTNDTFATCERQNIEGNERTIRRKLKGATGLPLCTNH
jgi:hypothetical protein